MSDLVVDYSHVRGWLFPRGLSRYYKPISYHQKDKSTTDIALNFHFLRYFSFAMRYCFFIAPLYWDLWGGRFCAADSYHLASVIPDSFQYDDLFQSKFIIVHQVNELYIYTKFHHVLTTVRDTVPPTCTHVYMYFPSHLPTTPFTFYTIGTPDWFTRWCSKVISVRCTVSK